MTLDTKSDIKISDEAMRILREILERKGIAEVRVGKNGLLITEIKRKLKYSNDPQ